MDFWLDGFLKLADDHFCGMLDKFERAAMFAITTAKGIVVSLISPFPVLALFV